MNKNIVKKIVAISVVAFFPFISIGCESNYEADGHITHLNLRPVEHEDWPWPSSWYVGEVGVVASFGISAQDLELGPYEHYYGIIEIEKASDLLEASFGNYSTHDFYYLFKIFLNYEAVPFRVLGQEEYETSFTFFLERGYQVDIPFVLDAEFVSENSTQKLTAVFIVDPSRDILNEENTRLFWGRNAFVLNNDLIVGSGSDFQFEAPTYIEILNRKEDDQFVDLFVSSDFELNEWGFVLFPELMMQARRGGEIELLFHSSPEKTFDHVLDNYLMIGILNGEQILLNGEPFLLVDVTGEEFDHIMDHGTFTIDAIDKVGFHDFIMILIPNPSLPNSRFNYFPLQSSNRLVIEIIE